MFHVIVLTLVCCCLQLTKFRFFEPPPPPPPPPQQQQQNMAVSNAFGSNTFNIMVGLGWPWVFYIAFANHFQPYHGLRNDGILESVIILATVLLVFIIIVLTNDFTLCHWHGTLFLILYVAYLVFAVGQVYL